MYRLILLCDIDIYCHLIILLFKLLFWDIVPLSLKTTNLMLRELYQHMLPRKMISVMCRCMWHLISCTTEKHRNLTDLHFYLKANHKQHITLLSIASSLVAELHRILTPFVTPHTKQCSISKLFYVLLPI